MPNLTCWVSATLAGIFSSTLQRSLISAVERAQHSLGKNGLLPPGCQHYLKSKFKKTHCRNAVVCNDFNPWVFIREKLGLITNNDGVLESPIIQLLGINCTVVVNV